MSPESTDPSQPTPTPKSRAAQDKKLTNDSGAAGQTIRAVMADTEVVAELTEGGYPPEELGRGLGLQKALENALAERQAADGAETAANRAYKSAEKALRINTPRSADWAARLSSGILRRSKRWVWQAMSRATWNSSWARSIGSSRMRRCPSMPPS